ncbi:MAG TPA: UbiA family prenyltransferase [Candidatus Thermoplasmatota archaeon]|nr:UbiA family prenyltransferase [Candidatus Thermoplasmatota archaeon]
MRMSRVSNKLAGYLELLRPFTLLAPLIVSLCVMVASYTYTKTMSLSAWTLLSIILPASLCFALLNGASNALNQATDWQEDKISKPYRPIPKGTVSRREAFIISFILYSASLILSTIINSSFSIILCVIALFSITYSVQPRVKKILILNQAWVALPRGFLAIMGSWSVFGNPLQPLPLAMGCIATLFLFGGTATKDILDAQADKTVGTKTLINVLGIKKTTFISLCFMIAAFLLILPLVLFQILSSVFLPLTLLIVFSGAIGWSMLHTHHNQSYENTSAWTLMYATYFLFALGFAVITIVFAS